MIALSRPRTPILLRMSVADQATVNMPSAAGPSSRATRKVKMPRKFDAIIATVLKNAPRFSSTPVSSTRAGASTAGGGTRRVPLIVVIGWVCLLKSRARQESRFIDGQEGHERAAERKLLLITDAINNPPSSL